MKRERGIVKKHSASIEFVIRGRGIAVFEFSIHAFGFDTPFSFHVARSSAVCS